MLTTPSCIYQKLEMEKISVIQLMLENIQKEICKLAQLSMLQQSLTAGHSTSNCQTCLNACLDASSPFAQYIQNSTEKIPLLSEGIESYKVTLDALLNQARLFILPANRATSPQLSRPDSDRSITKELINFELSKGSDLEKSKENSCEGETKIKKEESNAEETEELSVHGSHEEHQKAKYSVPKVDRLQNSGFKPKSSKTGRNSPSLANTVVEDRLLSALNRQRRENLVLEKLNQNRIYYEQKLKVQQEASKKFSLKDALQKLLK